MIKQHKQWLWVGLWMSVSAWGASTPTPEPVLSSVQAPVLAIRSLWNHVKWRLSQVWNDGKFELYGSGYAWHNRYWYTPEKVKNYNEFAGGTGFGHGFTDEDGDSHLLFALAFFDSHANLQPVAGTAFMKQKKLTEETTLGVGFNWFFTARKDILHGVPFLAPPLPMISIGYQRFSLYATYVPGKTNVGNVLFVFGKWTIE